jgi:hypothetical protein
MSRSVVGFSAVAHHSEGNTGEGYTLFAALSDGTILTRTSKEAMWQPIKIDLREYVNADSHVAGSIERQPLAADAPPKF